MPNIIDFSKLLGFDSVADQLFDGVDFQDPTIGAKLGAKVGEPTEPMKLEFSKLLGFDSVADKLSTGVNFQDATIGAKLGAKVGIEPVKPATE